MLHAFKTDLGALLKYSQLFPLCFAVFVSMLGFGLVMPLLPLYARDFGATGLQLGMLTASFALTRAVATLPGGWVADKAGRKKPIVFGLLMYSVVMALYGFSQDVNQLILLRAIQGLASGVVWPVISTMVVDIVQPNDRAKALGLYETMWFLGMIVGPALGGILAGLFSISVPFFVCGGLAFMTTILMVFTVRETIPTINDNHDAFHARKNASTVLTSSTNVRGRLQGIRQLTPYPRIFCGLCVARFIIAFSNSLIQPVLSVYANEVLGISEIGVGMLFTVMSIVTLLATLPMGVIADNTGRKPMLMMGKVFDGASAFLVIFSGSFWPLLLVMMLRGFGRGATSPPITAMFSTVVPSSMRAKGMGVFNSFQNLGLVVGSFIAGFLYEFYSPVTPFIACGVISFIGVALVWLMVSEPKPHQNC
ncbi:MAG TPA: MFS transporter [Candidatus Bathyarchaeia archaeon]|nr:MFS transporter [Candidatus Bathyarchaeia archaeon]